MAAIDPADALARRTTRRRVLARGAKLAYAAPLIAVSMKMSGIGASAQEAISGGVCTLLPDSAQCTADDQCCSGACLPHPNFTFVTTCSGVCNPKDTPCDLSHPGECCSGICFAASGCG